MRDAGKKRSTTGRFDAIQHHKQMRALEDLKQGADMIHFRKFLTAEWRTGWRVLEAGR